LIAELPEDIEEENSGDAQHDEAFEEAVDGRDRSGVNDPTDPRKRDEAEQNGNQEHHWEQSPSSEETMLRLRIIGKGTRRGGRPYEKVIEIKV
jgi:hypothetical protein